MTATGSDPASSLERKLGTFVESLNVDELGLLIDAFNDASTGGAEVEGFAAGAVPVPVPPMPGGPIPSMDLLTRLTQALHDMRKAQIENMRV